MVRPHPRLRILGPYLHWRSVMPREEDAVEHPGPELDPSAAAAQAIAEADGDAEVLQAAIAAQAQARAKAKGMSSGYAAMSNSLLRKALKG